MVDTKWKNGINRLEKQMAKFTQYRIFVTAVETGSISAAAQQLNISASAVSKQIAALEQNLGVRLLERSNRSIRPTEMGQSFFQNCKAILRSVADAEVRLKAERDEVQGVLRITLSTSLLESALTEHLADFSSRHPAVTFDLHASEHTEDLHEANFDFAFRIGVMDDHSQLVATPLAEVRPIFCASAAYVEQHGVPDDYSEYAQHRLVLLPFSHMSDSLRMFLRDRKAIEDASVHHRANDVVTSYRMIKAGMGIGLMLDCSIRSELEEGAFVDVSRHDPLPSKILSLVYRKNAYMPSKNNLFKQFIKERFREC